MNLQKLGACYSQALEISDLIGILNTYLEFYQDEIHICAELSIFSRIIYAKNEKLIAELDEIFSDEAFKTNNRPQNLEDG